EIDMSVKDIYWSLYSFLEGINYHPMARNVAIAVRSNEMWVDVVPGRQQEGSTDHTLYRRRADTWSQTNVAAHIKLVAESGRTDEIRAVKVWRERHRLEFPSFYLELTVLEALRGREKGCVGVNFKLVLVYLADKFVNIGVTDPANSNNCVSDD